MTDIQREQIEQLRELGFPVMKLTYEQLVTELIHKYIEVSTACEWTAQEAFAQELKRLLKPNN